MTDYTALWREIESRLLAASALVTADAPELAASVEPKVRDWLDHNELELALDELLDAVDEGPTTVRRRFWEELATAAMLMRLHLQFSRIADCIPNLEPHVFGTAQAPPYVYCDFNGRIAGDLYSLNSVATALDFARLRIVPTASQELVLYQEDADENGKPIWLLATGRIVEHEPFGLAAHASQGSFRTRPR